MSPFKEMILFVVLLAFVAQKGGWAQDSNDDDDDEEGMPSGPPPVILTDNKVFEVREGESVRLPCKVESSYVVPIGWYKGVEAIYVTQKLRAKNDERLIMQDDNSLLIKDIKRTDDGQYNCKIFTNPVMEVSHTLTVLYPPEITGMPASRTLAVLKGDEATLTCNASGNPPPKVTWTRKGKLMPSGQPSVDGFQITFNEVNRHHSGKYECTAYNGLERNDTGHINLQVRYAPEIEIERETIISDVGLDSELVCTVHAEPKARVSWYKNGVPLAKSDHYQIMKEENKYAVSIKYTNSSDFGEYMCSASNSQGADQKVIELSGSPSQATVKKSDVAEDGRSPRLEWVIESFAPILEYKLMYRKVKGNGEWTEVTKSPDIEIPEGNIYTVSHTLSNLEPGDYEVMLSSKNTHGWSRDSPASRVSTDFQNTEAESKVGAAESKDPNGADDSRPRVLALMTIASLCTFFL